MKEIWRDIPDYIGLYQVSNWGRVKSLNYNHTHKEQILKPSKSTDGYLVVNLFKNKTKKTKYVHHLVFDIFGYSQRNGRLLQIDHINNDKTDNRIENLQLLPARENSSKGKLQKKKSSKYTGVCFDKKLNKWRSAIEINKNKYYLGIFETEKEAGDAYQYALINKDEILNRPIKKKTSKYKGVSFHKQHNKWYAYLMINKKPKFIGLFESEEEANQAKLKAKENL